MSHYPLKKLSEICEISIGKTPPRGGGKFWDTGKTTSNIWLSIADLSNSDNKIISDSKEYISDLGASLFKPVEKGTLLVSFKLTLGRLAFAGKKLRTNEAIAALKIKDSKKTNKYYLYYFLSFFDWVAACKGDTKVKGRTLNKAKLREIEIPLPPLSVQDEIVAKLDAALASIDEAKIKTEQALAATRELWESTLEEAFRGGDGWGRKNLNEISENLDNRRKPITKNVRSSGEYPYYGASGIVDYVADYIFDEEALLISEDGANLLARVTPIAFSAIGKYWVNNHAHILKFSNKVTQKFVELYLNSIPLDDFITGAAQPKLNQKQLNSIPIPFPDIAEQSRIVARLDAVRTDTDRLASLYEQKLADLDELRRSVLQEAFAQNT